jgi:hypothetical protein
MLVMRLALFHFPFAYLQPYVVFELLMQRKTVCPVCPERVNGKYNDRILKYFVKLVK